STKDNDNGYILSITGSPANSQRLTSREAGFISGHELLPFRKYLFCHSIKIPDGGCFVFLAPCYGNSDRCALRKIDHSFAYHSVAANAAACGRQQRDTQPCFDKAHYGSHLYSFLGNARCECMSLACM